MAGAATATGRPLAVAKRQAAVDHVLFAVRRFVIANGLAVTMDQLAETAGVSRRTLFRLFDTRERLIAGAFKAGMAGYARELPPFNGDVEGWLRATCNTTHRLNSSVGPGFWELTSRPDLPPDLAALERQRRREQRAVVARIASTLWTASGGAGDAPSAFIVSVGAHLSPHFTAGVMTEVSPRWQTAAEVAYDSILAALTALHHPTNQRHPIN